MSYTLYNREGSGGFAVEAALVMADLPFELVTLSSTPGTPLDESFKATNPWGQIPTLIDSDGNAGRLVIRSSLGIRYSRPSRVVIEA